MKKHQGAFIILLFSLLYSCNSKTGNNNSADQQPAEDKEYYPIGNYIQRELAYLDSVPLAIIRYQTITRGTDTSIIEKKDFARIAGNFIHPDISSPQLKKQYEENSFIDATIGTISLTYTATNDTAQVRKADVLLKQDDTSVRTIYVEKNISGADSAVLLKMLWTANRNCQVTTIIRKKGVPEKIIQDIYVWDSRN